MIEKGEKYGYNVDDTGVVNTITIERVTDGVAYSTSGQVMDMGPFSMTFDALTGLGIGIYAGTFLSCIDSPKFFITD